MRWNKILGTSLLAALTITSVAVADSLVTLSGKRVEGDIVAETADTVTIRTKDYGDLRFRRLDIKEIRRSSGPGSGSPFGTTTGGNPFGSTGGNPFGAPPSTNGSVSVAIPTPAPTPEPMAQRPVVARPNVPFAWDAVLYSIPAERLVSVSIQPDAPMQQVSEETSLRSGAELTTADSGARIVLKNGRDVVRVSPHSSIRLVESVPTQSVIELRRGSVWVEVAESSGNGVVLLTTNAELRSRGGVFRVADALDRGYHVAVVEGSLPVTSRVAQARTIIEAGQMLVVRPDGAITEPLALTRQVRREDVEWDSLEADWWFRMDRTAMPGEVDPLSNLVSINDLQGYLRTIAEGFLRFAEDTGHVPSTEEAFSVLRQNTGQWNGWKGPYIKGLLPPLDSWGRPMRYLTRRTGQADNIVGIVYSTGEDNIDNQGDPSADVTEMVLYYQIESLRPTVTGRY
ncbi:MAG: type II secretion system protein GspG [Candidatus Sumerlaeia bacterium]|nr:type II secretion system protein GspG [Candidatus Sumerlaeia bacterium]